MASLLAVLLMNAGQLNNTYTLTMTGQIVAIVLTMIVALVIGLIIRRSLVNRLKKTILDNWVVQTIGVFVIAVMLILGIFGGLVVWNRDLFGQIFHALQLDSLQNIQDLSRKLFFTALLLALGIGTARTVNKLTIRGMGEQHVDINIRTFLGRMLYIITLIIVGFWILAVWQVPFGVPVAAISVLTVAIAFSIQDILKDLVAGFYILLERPFYIGDQISVTTAPTVVYVGRVDDVQLRATKLRLTSGEEVSVPNSTIFGGVVVNNTFYGERRATIDIKLQATDYAKDETANSILNALKEFGKVLEKPDPAVLFIGYQEEKALLAARFWVTNGQVIDLSDIMYALHDIFPTADITIREPVGSF